MHNNLALGQKKIMFASCYPTDPVWNPPTQNFLLTQGEKKRGIRIIDSCEFISNKIDNLIQNMSKLILQGKYVKFNV